MPAGSHVVGQVGARGAAAGRVVGVRVCVCVLGGGTEQDKSQGVRCGSKGEVICHS
jgi:hypothetical protein